MNKWEGFISPLQSPRVVSKQLEAARKQLAKKQNSLADATGKSQITRLKLEIAEIERSIKMYSAFLKDKGEL